MISPRHSLRPGASRRARTRTGCDLTMPVDVFPAQSTWRVRPRKSCCLNSADRPFQSSCWWRRHFCPIRSKSSRGFADLPRHVDCRRATALSRPEMVVDQGRRAPFSAPSAVDDDSYMALSHRSSARATLNSVKRRRQSSSTARHLHLGKVGPAEMSRSAIRDLARGPAFPAPLRAVRCNTGQTKHATRDCAGVVSAFCPSLAGGLGGLIRRSIEARWG
jgi:hypothetical protein